MSGKLDVFFVETLGLSSEYGVGSYGKHLMPQLTESPEVNKLYYIQVGYADTGSVTRTVTSDKIINIKILFKAHNPVLKDIDCSISTHMAKVCFSVILQEPNIDEGVFHINSILQYQLAVIAKSYGFKVVFVQHISLWRAAFKNNYDLLRQASPGDMRFVALDTDRRQCLLADRIICLSAEAKSFVVQQYALPKSKIAIICNGLKSSHQPNENKSQLFRSQYGFREDDFIFLFVGRITRDKGIFDLITSFMKFSKQRSDIKLLIAGGGDMVAAHKIAHEGCGKVILTGFIPPDKLNDLYKIAHAGVLPSYHEQSSYAVLEMMSNGLPMVLSQIPGFQIFRDRIHVLKARMIKGIDDFIGVDQHSLTACMEEIYQSKSLRKQLTDNAIALLDGKLSANSMGRKTLGVYKMAMRNE
ncbi:glycosyltransferase [Chitinophaga sp. 22536]|uniref:glycosyltransferase n=1 Tax=unclassified Chitinophaga TaxID=2619133 RepID=UPI003F831586